MIEQVDHTIKGVGAYDRAVDHMVERIGTYDRTSRSYSQTRRDIRLSGR